MSKDSNNSSKPPSSDIVKPDRKVRKKVKRKRGAQKGHKKKARPPFQAEQIDETFEYEYIDAEGLIPLDEWYVVQQVSLPAKLYCVTEHRARKYKDPKTGKIYIAPLPEDVRKGGLLVEMLGKSFKGVIGCDYYGSYRKYCRLFRVLMQYCMAHLIRDIKFLAEHSNKRLARWDQKLLKWLKKIFDTLHNSSRYTTAKGYLRRMEILKQVFLKQVRRPPDHKLAKNLKKRFKARAAGHYFRFITDPNIEPTNNGAEREVRHVAIDRRITQGTRGEAGMRWCERIWTTVATCKKQSRNVFDFIHDALMAHWYNQPCPELV